MRARHIAATAGTAAVTGRAAELARMPRVESLTGLRWFAAFGVFIHHVRNLAPLPGERFLWFGHLGVTFFFVLSGFVLTWSWSQTTGARTFYWRRFARIYPAHLAALVLAIPIFYAITPDPAQWWVKPLGPVLILSVFLLQGWSRDPAVLFSGNPAAWTLTCEAFFYSLHPLMQAGLRRVGKNGALIAAAAVLATAGAYRCACIAAPSAWFATQLPWPVIRITEFALGMALAWAMRQGWRPRVPVMAGYVFFALVLGGYTWATLSTNRPFLVTTLLAAVNEAAMVVCAVLIVVVAARDLRGGRSWLRSRVLVALGEWSYAFYLVHATVIYALVAHFGPQPRSWHNLTWVVAAFAASLAVSAALHLLLEKPAERRMRRWWNARR